MCDTHNEVQYGRNLVYMECGSVVKIMLKTITLPQKKEADEHRGSMDSQLAVLHLKL